MKTPFKICFIAIVSCLVFISCGKTEEHSTMPPANERKVVFEGKIGEDYHLFTMNSDGSNERQITNFTNGSNYTFTGDASWNFDQTKLIFTTNKDHDNGSRIYIGNSDGTNLTRINHINVNAQNPKLSPNGTKILFESKIGDDYHLFTMNADGSNETQITNFVNGTNFIYNGQASWNSDGTRIIFITNKDFDNGSLIYFANPDGTNLTRVNHINVKAQKADLSPDGTKILFESKIGDNYHLFLMNVDGSNERQITNFTNGANYSYTGDASWNSDGTKIIFATNKDNDNGSRIYTMKPDGTELTRIIHNARGEQSLGWN